MTPESQNVILVKSSLELKIPQRPWSQHLVTDRPVDYQ